MRIGPKALLSVFPKTNVGRKLSEMRQMLQLEQYKPPDWAGVLTKPAPTHRFALGLFPTPIHRWHLPGVPEGVEVYIKRDDLTGNQLSGNKVRKLEFLLAEAKAQGHDSVITIGGIQSNHCRATAVSAAYLGLEAHLILRNSRTVVDEDPGLVGNLLVDRLVGAHIHQVTKEEYVRVGSVALGEALKAELQTTGQKNPYVIPVGGSNALGTWGYLEWCREISQQISEVGLAFSDVVMACGSGGTTAGIALGSHLAGLKWRVHAYGVCDDENYFYGFIDGILADLGAGPDAIGRGARDLFEAVQAKGAGYALSQAEELQTVADVAQATGVILDPVYSGKAVHGLLKEMQANPEAWRGRKILFVHTGGLLGVYDKVQQLQPLVEATARAHRMHVP